MIDIDVDLWEYPYLQASLKNFAKTEDTMSHSNQCVQSKHNRVPRYQRFQKTIVYLEKSAKSVENLSQIISTIFPDEKWSYQPLIEDLLHLRREVPYQFLSAIHASIEQIKALCIADNEEFERIKERRDLFPYRVIIRFIPAVYQSREFPYTMKERDAIQYILENLCEGRYRCAINYPELKTIYIEPNGEIETTFYPPTLHFGLTSLTPSQDGSNEGVTHIVPQ
jgi:hypothetical protein